MLYRTLPHILSLIAALVVAAPSCADEERKKYAQAQDMAYGVVLYNYFQGNYFDALSTLMVARERDAIKVHSDNAALIEGGISLGFGLRRRAAALFEQQLREDDRTEAAARRRRVAWLKLAELNYLQGDWPQAAEQLQKSGAKDESVLALNLALRRGDFSAAETILAKKKLPLEQRILGTINLAAAQAREGNLSAAALYYQKAAKLAVGQDNPTEAILVLADKAYTGAGYAFALQEQHDRAIDAFRRVRLGTPWSSRALLGLGWSAVNSAQYPIAVDALQYLVDHNSDSEAAREAMVALPFSYEKLQRPEAALSAYQKAEEYYLTVLAELEQLQKNIEVSEFAPVGGDAQRYGWLQLAETPQLMRDNRRYLRPILQSDKFQLRLSELRDLRQLSRVIEGWQERLPHFTHLIEARAQRHRALVDMYNSAQFDQRLQIAEQEYLRLEEALARIEKERDALALLAAQQSEYSEMLSLLRRAEQRYKVLENAGRVRESQKKTLARARGILLWLASEEYHHNLWQKRKTLRDLREQLEAAERQRRETDLVARRAPQLNQLRTKVAAAAPQLAAQGDAIARAADLIEASIRADVIAELNRERARIQQYMAHSRLAIARLQDAAMQAGQAVESGEGGEDG